MYFSECDMPPAIPNAVIYSGDTAPYFVGDSITYTCEDGFSLTLSSPIVCDCVENPVVVWFCFSISRQNIEMNLALACVRGKYNKIE